MADFAYAVHTDVCTYLLDDTGVCLWVLSPSLSTAPAIKSLVGAHFMACIDTRVPGKLVGELVEGSAALFVSVNKETLRPSLLRTGIIRRVQERDPSQVQALLEPSIEDIDVHFEDDASQRETTMVDPRALSGQPVAMPSRESETVTTQFKPPAAAGKTMESVARRELDLSNLDRPTVPKAPTAPSPDASAQATETTQAKSPAEVLPAQPPPCPDLPEPVPAELPKAAPTLVIDMPREKHGPPPLPTSVAHTPLPAPLPPPLPTSALQHTPLPAPLPPPVPTSGLHHTPLPPPLPLAHTPAPPPLPKPQGATPPPLPVQLSHTPLPPPLQRTPGPPPLPGSTDRSPVPPPVWITHTALPEASPPALPLPPVVVASSDAPADPSGNEAVAAPKEEGGKSRIPKRKSAPDNSAAAMGSPRSRGPQPSSKGPKQPGSKKVPPPPLPPPPRSMAGARSNAFDENAPLPLRRRKKKD